MRNTGATLARERTQAATHMARKRAAGRDIIIPAVANPRRRRQCRQDPALFLQTYMPRIFYDPFTQTHKAMIAAFIDRIKYGGWQAVAAPRSDGKTSIALGLTIYALVYGLLKFPVIVAANAVDAARNLSNIKGQFEDNDIIAADFPEICTPIRALEGASQRANLQTVDGRRTRLKWTGEFLTLPAVDGSDASGSIVTSRGIDTAIRGLLVHGRRPDLVIIDDPETRDSARSSIETDKRAKTIEADIVGLAGPDQTIAIIYLCTLWKADCLADLFTDPTKKPAWHGVRHKLLQEPPAREDLWATYIEIRQRSQLAGDKSARAAFKFYQDNRAKMDRGAVLGNLHRYSDKPQADGTPLQLSALQFCYDTIADIGLDNFNTEFQNTAPEADTARIDPIDAAAVMKSSDGRDRGTTCPDPDHITAAIDVGGRVLHWVVTAWKGAAGYIVDYGVERVNSPLEGSLEADENRQATQQAILSALLELRDAWAEGWPDAATGEVHYLDLALIDVGWARSGMDAPIYTLIKASPHGLYRAAKGFGTGSGQATRYSQPKTKGQGKRIGEHWYATRQPFYRAWLYNIDADHWKTWTHRAFLAGGGQANSLQLPGDDPVAHRDFARHICAELWEETYTAGAGWKGRWRSRGRANHYLDAVYNTRAAAAICGVRTVADAEAPKAAANAAQARRAGKKRISLAVLRRERALRR